MRNALLGKEVLLPCIAVLELEEQLPPILNGYGIVTLPHLSKQFGEIVPSNGCWAIVDLIIRDDDRNMIWRREK